MSESHNNGIQILSDIIKDFDLEKPVPEYFYRGFVRFFRDKNRSFAPRKEELNQYDSDNLRNGVKLGEIDFSGREQMVVCTFETTQSLTERSGKKAQYREGKKILKDSQKDAGIFIFYDQKGNFRFSLIYVNYSGTRRDWSSFRRFTYFVSREFTNKTFLERIGDGDFSSPDKIKEAFSVEPVTRQFYSELQNWYFWAMDKVQFPKDFEYSVDSKKDEELRNSINIIRLITRIIFIWFIRQRGIIPDVLFDKHLQKTIVKDFCRNNKSANYYNAILQNLFFGTLNQKMDERKFANENGYPAHKKEFGVKTLYRYSDKFLIAKEEAIKLFKDIPFLNGGLFDCLDKEDETGMLTYIDGFSRNPKKQAIIPDYLLFEEKEERVDLSDYGLGVNKSVKGLFEILNNYNFTIDENTPIDQEVALDPELLGKVFENLLASYNPETATTARKATGSYYTPREIVDYTVEESLVAYLTNVLDKYGHHVETGLKPVSTANNNESRLRHLLSYADEPHKFSEAEARKIIAAINNIKILDPACGSGAFPMGMLHKLVHILHKLDTDNKVWYEIQYQKAIAETEVAFRIGKKEDREQRLKEINEVFDQNINEPDYARKLYLIENCIYGVDIQPIAVQISKLRFFISLVIDQKVDKQKPNCGILSLPNLETKFVAANTLIGLDRPRQLAFKNPDIAKREEELKQIRHKYFEAKTRKEKMDYQRKDVQIRKEIAYLLKHSGWDTSTAEKIAKFDLYDQNTSADWFDQEWMFGIVAGTSSSNEQNGFDIVIANPPYGFRGVLSAEEKRFFRNTMQIEFPSGDIAELFIVISLSKLVRQNGELTFIVPKKSLYGESWRNVRRIWLDNDLRFLMDASQAFENVLLEQNAFSIQKRVRSNGSISVGALDQNSGAVHVFGKFPLQDIFTPDLRNAQIYKGLYPSSLLRKIAENALPNTSSLIKVEIGISNITQHLTFESKGNYPCVKGIDIVRYGLKNPTRYLNGKIAREYLDSYQDEKIIGQEIVAHIQNPTPHILIMLFYDDKHRLFNDTCIEVKVLDKSLHKKFVLSYLQSEFCNWYAYNFIYNRAVRTMHFINYYVTQLPIPKITESAQQPFITLVNQILAAKKQDPNADTSALERQIDQLVYKLYGLTEDEIAIAEGGK
ncbi:MAG: hypothetical protein HYV59_03095 [Planctomycetes bacterium]|nr:hypothetical protein [Planctomycetota bacterium]